MDKTADYNRRRIIYLAKKHAKDKICPKCHSNKKEWLTVPLWEYGDPEMPSQIVLKCKNCPYNETFAIAPDEQARAYAKKIMEENKGFKVVKPGDVDKLIKSK